MEQLKIEGARGAKLSARLDTPDGAPKAVALFAHCFTCNKDIFAAREVSRQLAARGFAVVRFDFTGLGSSEGEFASTDFSSNVEDIVRVAEHVAQTVGAPSLLVGHSLGGAAVLEAAAKLPSVAAVATIGAPADAVHVTENFAADVSRIEEEGSATVSLAGRAFTIRREFLEDLRKQSVEAAAKALKAALLVMHAPRDATVGIDNATRLFVAAKHPKSFVSLDDADHLLSGRAHARYAADVIAAWASRYVGLDADPAPTAADGSATGVRASHVGGKFRTRLVAGPHTLTADEPTSVGGDETGPSPYDYVSMGLAACTLMTMRMYADRKGWEVDATVDVDHGKVHSDDCADCVDATPHKDGRVDRFERTITFGPGTDPQNHERLLEIADRCPVHRTLERASAVVTKTG